MMTLAKTAETSSRSGDELLLERLQSRSDDRAAWEAAVEIFRRARTNPPANLYGGWRSDRPEVKAVLEAAEARHLRASPHWPLSRLLSDSRDYVRFGVIDLLAELASDDQQTSVERARAAGLLQGIATHECSRTREYAGAAGEKIKGLPPASLIVSRFKRAVGIKRGWITYFCFMTGFNVMMHPLIRRFTGESIPAAAPVIIIGLMFMIPFFLNIFLSATRRSRLEFDLALDSLERLVREAPASAQTALPELDALRKRNLKHRNVGERAERLASEIRTALRESLPIAIEAPTPTSELLPLPSDSKDLDLNVRDPSR